MDFVREIRQEKDRWKLSIHCSKIVMENRRRHIRHGASMPAEQAQKIAEVEVPVKVVLGRLSAWASSEKHANKICDAWEKWAEKALDG